MSENFVEAAAISDIPDGQVKIFEYDDISIAICNVKGEFYAIENLCSHDDGPLGNGKLCGKNIECPRHGAQFDVTTGEVKRMPAHGPIETFPVIVKDGRIFVNLEE